jgi:hypothetical protein
MPHKLPDLLETVFARASPPDNNYLFTKWKTCNSLAEYLAVLKAARIEYEDFPDLTTAQIIHYQTWLEVARQKLTVVGSNPFDIDVVGGERERNMLSAKLDKSCLRHDRSRFIVEALEAMDYYLMQLIDMEVQSDRGLQNSPCRTEAFLTLRTLLIESGREIERLVVADAADQDIAEAEVVEADVMGEEDLLSYQERTKTEIGEVHRSRRRLSDNWDEAQPAEGGASVSQR